MLLLVISDLHIGKKGSINPFGWTNERFIQYLDSVISDYQIDKVILNGDIYDLYSHSYETIYDQNRDIIDYFHKKECIYIKGNHDFLSKEGLNHYTIVNSDYKSIHIEHGHNADFLNGTSLGRHIAVVLYFFLVRLFTFGFVRNIFYKIMEYNDEVNRIPRKRNTYKYLGYALKLLKKHDVVILSHTHKLESFKTYFMNIRKRYLNTGACSLGRFQGVIIDTETLKFDTIKVTKDDVENTNLVMSALASSRIPLKVNTFDSLFKDTNVKETSEIYLNN
jgi:predicted phosphodiesterase